MPRNLSAEHEGYGPKWPYKQDFSTEHFLIPESWEITLELKQFMHMGGSMFSPSQRVLAATADMDNETTLFRHVSPHTVATDTQP